MCSELGERMGGARGRFGIAVLTALLVPACSWVIDADQYASTEEVGRGVQQDPVSPGDGGSDAEASDAEASAGSDPDEDAGRDSDAGPDGAGPDGGEPMVDCSDPETGDDCVEVDCGAPTAPEHGSVATPSGTSLGHVADHDCDDGYGIVGAARQTCEADGTWSGDPPTCAIGDCPSLQSPDGGLVMTPTGTTFDSVATYTCDTGYALDGEATRTCLADRTWSSAAPSCTIRDCGALPAPSSGSVATPAGTTYGATATYACDLGHTLDGAATRSCGEDGSWSGSDPACPIADECEDGSHGCGDGGTCTSGADFGYDCDCNGGYVDSGGDFPSCTPVPLLQANRTTINFGSRENGTTSAATSWTITNVGAAATGTLALTSSNTSDFQVDDGCSGSLAPGASCSVGMRFAPSNFGVRGGTLSLGNAAAGSMQLMVSGNSQARLTVTRGGTGTGTISGPGGIACGSTCSALFDYGAIVDLRADTQNGSSSVLTGWSANTCSGPVRDCPVTVAGSITVTATFATTTHNLIFVTSESFAANVGGAPAFDARCNARATAAGINNASGTGYVAAVSDANSAFTNRLGASVRGWTRLDGRPVGSTTTAMMAGTIYHPVAFDEVGRRVDTGTWSGVAPGSASTQHCTNWTTTASNVFARTGHSLKGPRSWIGGSAFNCSTPRPVMCMGNTRTAALTPATTSGRRIWLSNNYRAGAVSPDQRCFADRPAGVASAVALVGRTDSTAASRLSPTANYVRPDGQLVGTGQQIIDMQIITGIWQLGNGSYYDDAFNQNWAGAESLTALATPASSCNNWTNGTSAFSGYVGDLDTTSLRFWWTFGSVTCDAFGDPNRVLRLYCVEQ